MKKKKEITIRKIYDEIPIGDFTQHISSFACLCMPKMVDDHIRRHNFGKGLK